MLKDNRQGTDVLVHGDGSYSWVNKHTTVVELDSSGEDQL